MWVTLQQIQKARANLAGVQALIQKYNEKIIDSAGLQYDL